MSSTIPFWSIAHHSQCVTPAIVSTTSSRCHLSPATGSLRLIWLTNARPNFRPPLAHGLMANLMPRASRAENVISSAYPGSAAPRKVAGSQGDGALTLVLAIMITKLRIEFRICAAIDALPAC